MEKSENFWAGIWEGNTKTPQRKWMNTVAKKIGQKVTNVQEFAISPKRSCTKQSRNERIGQLLDFD